MVLLPDVCAVLHALEDHVEVVVEHGLVQDLVQPQPPPRLVALLKKVDTYLGPLCATSSFLSTLQ